MLGTKHAVLLATQVIRNDAVRPSPAGQMDTSFVYEPLVAYWANDDNLRSETAPISAM